MWIRNTLNALWHPNNFVRRTGLILDCVFSFELRFSNLEIFNENSLSIPITLALSYQCKTKPPTFLRSSNSLFPMNEIFSAPLFFFFFTFLWGSAALAVTHRPTSLHVRHQLQCSHIGTPQFSEGIHFLPFVVQRSWLPTATSVLCTTQISRQHLRLSAQTSPPPPPPYTASQTPRIGSFDPAALNACQSCCLLSSQDVWSGFECVGPELKGAHGSNGYVFV